MIMINQKKPNASKNAMVEEYYPVCGMIDEMVCVDDVRICMGGIFASFCTYYFLFKDNQNCVVIIDF